MFIEYRKTSGFGIGTVDIRDTGVTPPKGNCLLFMRFDRQTSADRYN